MKKHIFTYNAHDLLPYIDWSYLFHAWKTDSKSIEAEQLKKDAIELLTNEGDFTVKALFQLHEVHSDGDNIVFADAVLPVLRQQHNKNNEPDLCLSDFISPHKDHIGIFATSVAKDIEEKAEDLYKQLLIQTLCDRLAEAAATLLHLNVRTKKELWGYCPEENLRIEELLHEKNQGIRPAIGYPSLPDQSIIFIIDKLTDLSQIGITLTPNGAMQPHASVCGLMFSHPATRYFSIGKISDEQLNDYALRRGVTAEQLKPFLAKNIIQN